MGFFDAFKKKSSPNKEDNTIKHYKCGRWEQYDVLMNVNFSWQMIVELANYMASTDISNIDQVSISDPISGEDKDQTAIRDYADKILNKDFGTAGETKQCSPSPERVMNEG